MPAKNTNKKNSKAKKTSGKKSVETAPAPEPVVVETAPAPEPVVAETTPAVASESTELHYFSKSSRFSSLNLRLAQFRTMYSLTLILKAPKEYDPPC